MLHVLHSPGAPLSNPVLRGMFAARKRVFVDLLGWTVPVLHGAYEIDQFDDAHATYVVLTTADRHHLGSARLLPTTRPHILNTLFAELCEGAPPCDLATAEITRFCLDRGLSSRQRRAVRDALVTASVDVALARGLRRYTAIADLGWARQVLAFGWTAHPLGEPRLVNGAALCALAIDIAPGTPALLEAAGLHADPALLGAPERKVA